MTKSSFFLRLTSASHLALKAEHCRMLQGRGRKTSKELRKGRQEVKLSAHVSPHLLN